MKSLKDILTAIPIAILSLCFIILAFPFLIVLSPFWWIQEKRFIIEYNDFLQTIEGKNFFCYNNRKKGRKYIEEQIIPKLPNEIEILFLNGRKIENTKYDTKYLYRTFYGFKNYSRFPQLLKVRNGAAVDCSINSELFNCFNQGKDLTVIFNKMNRFFELNTKTPPFSKE